MKKAIFYGLLAASLALGSCGSKSAAPKADDKKSEGTKTVNIKLSELATNKDLNCQMTLEEGAIADTTAYQGKIYGFCSPECKAEFVKDPPAHLPKQ